MYQKIAKYVSQSVLGMIGMSIYILADTFFISWGFGSDGLAVLNLTLPIYGIIYAIGQMLGLGFAVVYSLDKAMDKPSDHYFMQALSWCLLLSVPFILIGALTPDRMLMLLGADASLAAMGKSYVRLIMCASPLFMANYVFTAFARNDHATTIAMTGALLGSFYNIVFDYVYMFPAGFGFTGAALATVGCPAISILICLTHFRGKRNTVGMKIATLSPIALKRACSLGMSGFVGEFSNAATSAVYNFMMLYLAGNIGVAAYGIIANIALVFVCIFNGIAQGLQPLISDSYGKGNKIDAGKYLKAGLFLATGFAVLFIAIGYIFSSQLVAIFNTQGDKLMAAYAQNGIHLYFLGFILAGVNVMLIAYYSAIGDSRPVIIGSLSRGLVFITAFAIILGFAFGMNGVWMSFLAAEALTLVIVLAMKDRKYLKSAALITLAALILFGVIKLII